MHRRGYPRGLGSVKYRPQQLYRFRPSELEETYAQPLEETAQEFPLFLVFEDLHLADTCTLELISELSRRRTPAKLMVLATETLQAGAMEHPLFALKQDLLIHRLCAQITLAPLAKKAVSELLRRELGQETPPALDSFVYQHSEGNPLLRLPSGTISLLSNSWCATAATVADGSSVLPSLKLKPWCPTNWRN